MENIGQYWLIINEDKKEYIEAHTFGDGIKLMEFGCSQCGTLTGLTLLLADETTNGRGNGDFRGDGKDILGRWHGDRIKIVGDYGDDGLYKQAHKEWDDISKSVLATIVQDEYVLDFQKEESYKSIEERLEKN